MKQLRVLAWLWVAVLLGTGLLGGLMVSRVGWALAMGLAIYGGNTEPVRPDLLFPWWGFGLMALTSVVGLAWALSDHRRGVGPGSASKLRAMLPLSLSYLGGLLAALLPFFQVFRLWSSIG